MTFPSDADALFGLDALGGSAAPDRPATGAPFHASPAARHLLPVRTV